MPSTAESRTRRVFSQAGRGLAARLGSTLATFLAMPIMLRMLGSEELGVWLVLLSVFQWMTSFDLGIAAGARNQIACAAALDDQDGVLRAISTGWWYIALTSFALLGLAAAALAFTPLVPWLETHAFGGVHAGTALWVVTCGACVSFALGYIQSVFAALEEASAFSTFSLLSNAGFLVLLAAGHALGLDRMAGVALLYAASMIGANLWLLARFVRRHPRLRPRRQAIDHGLRRGILGFGLQLFVIQLAAMVIFTTSRLMASTLLGPAQVVIYDAGFKVFALLMMVHTLVMSTMWSSFTQAYARGEDDWIRLTLRRLVLAMLPLCAGCAVLALLCPWLIGAWLGPQQVGSTGFYALMALATALSCWSNVFAYLLNGISRTGLQLGTALVSAAINIPATWFFTIHLQFGLNGIVLGTICSLVLFSLLGPVHAHLIFRKRRHGN